MATQIHWFPGHMNKALKEIEERVKLVDVVIELLDARAPFSSINEHLEKVIANKKRLVVFTKKDLADPNKTEEYKIKAKTLYDDILILNITDSSSAKQISNAVVNLGKEKREKELRRGMKPQPIRAMILGIPNVGKSSLINCLAKRKAAGVQNKPGFTRGEQWIKVNNDFVLLDTPGILPMNYEDTKKAAKLALIGSIREEILPNYDLVETLIDLLKERYDDCLKERFGIEKITNVEDVLKGIDSARHLLGDRDRAETLLLKEFKEGKLGRISLD